MRAYFGVKTRQTYGCSCGDLLQTMILLLLTIWTTASQNIATAATSPVSAPEFSVLSQHTQYVDRHNCGYVLKRKQEIHIPTYHAKLIFHLELPEWQVEFHGRDHDCASDRNWTRPCMQLRTILNAVRDVCSHTQRYITQQVRCIHEVVADLLKITRRGRHGFLMDVISYITGLATSDQVHAITS